MRRNRLAARGDGASDAFRGSAKGGGSGRSDTSPTGMHDSFEKRTGGLSQEGMRRLMPGRRGNGFRIHTTRQPRHASPDAPVVAYRPLYEDDSNAPRMRRKRAWEDYRSHSTPRSSTPVRNRTRRPPPANSESTRPCTRTLPPKGSTGRGAPIVGLCLRLQQTRPADPFLAPGVHNDDVALWRE